MSDASISNTSSDDKSSKAMGRLLMIGVAILAAVGPTIAFWAGFTGGGFN